jgi:hypothetical protein
MKSRTSVLESRTEPRRLTNDQAGRITASLRARPPRTIVLTCGLGDAEAFQFANDLKDAVTRGGWTVNGVNRAVFSEPFQGLHIRVGAQPAPNEAQWLFEALKTGGLYSDAILNPGSSEIDLLVGPRE